MITDGYIRFLLVAICLLGLFACRTEQPEDQIAIRPTLTSTAVPIPLPSPTHPPLIPTVEATLTPPTPTPFLLLIRPTVRDFITVSGISTIGLDTNFLEQRVIAPAILNSDRSFLLGYLVDPQKGTLPYELHFLRFDKATKTWLATILKEPKHPEFLDREFCPPTICYRLSMVTDYLETPRFYFAYMHLNPSAGWTAVLTPELELNTVLYGRVYAVFNDGTAVYNESIIHFAPTHYALISVYNPDTKESRRIFPTEPRQALWLARQELVAQIYEALGEDWCWENNHHCDAELFNNHLGSEVVINDKTDSLAFVVTFASELFVDLPDDEAVYIYRGVRYGDLEFREASQVELTQLFGPYELADLLEADALEIIFTEVAFIEAEPSD